MDNKLHLPKGIGIALTDDGRIIYNWQRFSWSVVLWLIIDLSIVWVISSGIKKDVELGSLDYSSAPLFMLIACISPVLVSSYFILGKFLNHTEFWVDGSELFIQHKPFPWFGNRVIPLTDIEGFTIEETHGRSGSTSYHLMADIQNKPRSKLFPMFSRVFVDLTNESRGDVVATLHKELMVLAKKRLPLTEAKAVTQSAEINEIWEMRHRSYLRLAFLALGVSLALTFVLFYASYRTDSFMRATQSWHSVDGTVIETEVVEKRLNDEINYSPRIVYRFSVDGKIYKNDRVGLFEPIYSFKIDAENALKSYPVGQTITVYYDPEQPGESLLDRSNTNIWRIFLYLVLLSDIIALIVFARFAVKHKSVTGYNLTIFDLLHNLRSQNNH